MVVAESIVVALIVACAGTYAAWLLMPNGLRSRFAAALARWSAHARLPRPLRSVLQRFAEAQAMRAPGCSACKSERPSNRRAV